MPYIVGTWGVRGSHWGCGGVVLLSSSGPGVGHGDKFRSVSVL